MITVGRKSSIIFYKLVNGEGNITQADYVDLILPIVWWNAGRRTTFLSFRKLIIQAMTLEVKRTMHVFIR